MVAGKGIVITATAAKAVDAGSSILLLPLRVLQRVLLGKLPEKATSGSFQETKVKRRGGLLTFWRRQPEVVHEEEASSRRSWMNWIPRSRRTSV